MSLTEEPLDVLAAGREPDRRRRLLAALVVLVLVVLAGAAGVLDHRSRAAEYRALASCRATAFAAVSEVQGVTTSMAEYVRPALAFDTGASNAGLYGMVATAAGPGVPPLNAAEAACQVVQVHGWHGDQTVARARLLAYVGAEAAFFRATAADGSTFFGPGPDDAQRRAASAAVDDARPGWVP